MPHVNIGKRIHVSTSDYRLTVDADAPGTVVVVATHPSKGEIQLPGNKEDAERFIEAYRIAVEEEVEYRTIEWKKPERVQGPHVPIHQQLWEQTKERAEAAHLLEGNHQNLCEMLGLCDEAAGQGTVYATPGQVQTHLQGLLDELKRLREQSLKPPADIGLCTCGASKGGSDMYPWQHLKYCPVYSPAGTLLLPDTDAPNKPLVDIDVDPEKLQKFKTAKDTPYPGEYVTSFCNQTHRLSDGAPLNHECYKLPVKALQLEWEGKNKEAIVILEAQRDGGRSPHAGVWDEDIDV